MTDRAELMKFYGTGAQTRFWPKVKKTKTCWIWLGAKKNGYGVFSLKKPVNIQAHRFAYELLVGPIPKGLTIDHLCRNRGCVNPAHLEPVTVSENLLRGISPPAKNAKMFLCKKGLHALFGRNLLRLGAKRYRRCRLCFNRGHVLRKRQRRLRYWRWFEEA